MLLVVGLTHSFNSSLFAFQSFLNCPSVVCEHSDMRRPLLCTTRKEDYTRPKRFAHWRDHLNW